MLRSTLWALLAVVSLPTFAIGTPTISPESKDLATRDLEPRAVVAREQFSWSRQNELLFELPISDVRVGMSCIDCQASCDISVNAIVPGAGENGNRENTLFNVTFDNMAASLDLNLFAEGQTEGFFPVWKVGPGVDVDLATLGLFLSIGIAFEVSGNINARGGYRFQIPNGVFMEFSAATGINAYNFEGAVVESIPFEVVSGSAIIKLALQLRVSLEAGVDLGPIDIGAETGVFANLPEIVANVHASDICSIEATVFQNINIGAFADADFDLDLGDKVTIEDSDGFAIGTTLWSGATSTYCLDKTKTTTSSSSVREIEATPTVSTTPVSKPSTKSPSATLSDTVSMRKTSSTQIVQDTTTPVPKSPTTISTISFFGNSTVTAPPTMHTSTVYSTKVYTVVACAVHVMNCPARWAQTVVVTDMVELYTTVCPVTETQIVPYATPTSKALTKIVLKDPVTLKPCPTPIKEVIAPPTYIPLVITTATVTKTRHQGSSGVTEVTAMVTPTKPGSDTSMVTHAPPTHPSPANMSGYGLRNGTASVAVVTAGAECQRVGSTVVILVCMVAGILAF